MFTGININETKRVTSKLDPGKDNPTYFTLGVLDSIVIGYIEDKTTSYDIFGAGERMRIDYSRRMLLMVKFGLRGMENFRHPETKAPAIFETETIKIGEDIYPAVKDSVLKLLHPELIQELAQLISSGLTLSEEEAKN